MSASSNVQEVRLSIPSSTQYLRVARLTATAAATVCGFDIEELEDLRIAVGEAVTVLIEAGGETVDLVICPEPGEVAVRGQSTAPGHPELDTMTEQILAATVSGFEYRSSGGQVEFAFSMRAANGGPENG